MLTARLYASCGAADLTCVCGACAGAAGAPFAAAPGSAEAGLADPEALEALPAAALDGEGGLESVPGLRPLPVGARAGEAGVDPDGLAPKSAANACCVCAWEGVLVVLVGGCRSGPRVGVTAGGHGGNGPPAACEGPGNQGREGCTVWQGRRWR